MEGEKSEAPANLVSLEEERARRKKAKPARQRQARLDLGPVWRRPTIRPASSGVIYGDGRDAWTASE